MSTVIEERLPDAAISRKHSTNANNIPGQKDKHLGKNHRCEWIRQNAEMDLGGARQ